MIAKSLRQKRPRVLFLGSLYAGHRTRFLNLQGNVMSDKRLEARFSYQAGWRPNGHIEQLPGPYWLRSRLRATLECAPFATLPRPEVIWTSAGTTLVPFLWAQLGPLRRPVIKDLDWTLAQQESLAYEYYQRHPKRGATWLVARLQERLLWKSIALFTPWTEWAARSLRHQGVASEQIRVLPPGVDLALWHPGPKATDESRPLRLLFVGGDFRRKGGDLLLEVFRLHFRACCELHIVTHADISTYPGIIIHRASPNAETLRHLYQQADLFVLPTRAECFGIAAVEALASGCPVVMSDIGGTRDIVEDGRNGWLITPDAVSLTAVLKRALEQRQCLPAMGLEGRQIAEERFDGRQNDGLLVDWILELAAHFRDRQMISVREHSS